MSELDPAAYSGVHTGLLRAGEWVSLTDAKGHRKSLLLDAGNGEAARQLAALRALNEIVERGHHLPPRTHVAAETAG